jgi:hypothetical protein
MELPQKKIVDRPHNGLRLGYCEAKDCKRKGERVVVAETRLTNGRVVCLCEKCLDTATGDIKRYRKGLKQKTKSDIIEVGDKLL